MATAELDILDTASLQALLGPQLTSTKRNASLSEAKKLENPLDSVDN